MIGKVKEFFRILGELKYMIPVMRYKWPSGDDRASLAHTFQATTEKFPDRAFIYFEEETCKATLSNRAKQLVEQANIYYQQISKYKI